MTRRSICDVRGWKRFAATILFGLACTAQGQNAAAIRRIAWSPQPMAVGSPCLFTVVLDRPALSVKGRWSGHDLVFSRAASANAWFALAGVDVEAIAGVQDLTLEVALADGEMLKAARPVEILPSIYKTLALHVASKYVEPDSETIARVAEEKKIKDAAFAHQIESVEWQGNFVPPVTAPATESFGTRRVFNGETASVHRGLDFRASMGTPVVAANSGEVVLAQNMFYEGGFVVIDHGLQFMTMYMHLSKIDVVVGAHVTKGQRLGLSGATGRVTGPHLHMAVRWQGAYLDPAKTFQLSLPDAAKKQ